jgi:hypothetical protein
MPPPLALLYCTFSGNISGLVRALTRHVKAQVGLDLSGLPPAAFNHFVDLTYSRSDAKAADTAAAAAAAIAAGVQPPAAEAAKAAAEAAEAAVAAEDGLAGLRGLDPLDPASHTYTQVRGV